MTTVPVYNTISKKALFARLRTATAIEVPWAPVINTSVKCSPSRHSNSDDECASKTDTHGSIKRILNRSRTNAGKVTYQVLWQDGAITVESVSTVRKVAFKLFEVYEHRHLGRQHTRSDNTDSSDTTPSPVSRRRVRKRVTWGVNDYLTDDDVDKENQGPAKRRRVESIAADDLKPRTGPWSELPYYLDDGFILEHWDTCMRCQQEGYPNGAPSSRKKKGRRKRPVAEDSFEMTSEEEEQVRGRLLLCITCAGASHEGCISQQNTKAYKRKCYDQDQKLVTQFQCPMCAAATKNMDVKFPRCDGCHETHRIRDVVFAESAANNDELKEDTQGLFRCRRCTRAYHYDCIPGSSNDDGRNDPLHENHWICGECTKFSKSVDLIVTWRIAGDPPIEKVEVGYDAAEPSTREYLVKWQDTGYTQMDWISESFINRIAAIKLKHFANRQRHEPFMTADQAVPKEWLTVERILTAESHDGKQITDGSVKRVKRAFVKYHGLTYDEIYWDTPPSEDSDLYAHFVTAFNNYKKACALDPPSDMQNQIKLVRELATKEHYSKHELKQQPEYVRGGNLMPHQLDGLNWLLFQWERSLGCVLADDMGLGKTIQIVTFLNYLLKKYKIYPFVVVVPLSTATNWLREFARWAPDMVVVPYYGSAKSRQRALQYEIFRGGSKKPRCHVVILTYESVALDTSLLAKVKFWPVLVVDEAQRLKNDSSLLFQKLLRSVRFDHPILMTGTPLQNNIRELINIMHFVDRKEFADVEELEQKYSELSHSTVQELHDQLKPYFLRRTKEVILKTLPPKSEIIVPVSMSPLQKEVYKDLLEKNLTSYAELTTSQKPKIKKTTLANTLMQLRKTLGHPYLLPDIEIQQKDAETTQQVLVDACAKLKVLNQMLPKLKKEGHRVLIFSTFKGTLDILEDYLAYEQYKYVRVDGDTPSSDRVACIDQFNVPDSDVFVFLLTTRAGGVGINLATADTVIMWDFDFNPHADLQAICRAYRIGQTKPVLVLRFMTRLSVEEKIAQVAKKKMVLDHLIVDKMDDDDMDENDVESIIKFGAQALFEGDDSKRISYDSAGIDKLLDRSEVAHNEEEQASAEAAVDPTAEPSSKPMSFSFAKVWNLDKDAATEDLPPDMDGDRAEDNDFWATFLEVKKAQAEAEKQKKEELGRGARKRAVVDYSDFDRASSKKDKGKKGVPLEVDPDYHYVDRPDVDEDLNLEFDEMLNIADGPPATGEPEPAAAPSMPQQQPKSKPTAKRTGKKRSPPKSKKNMPYPAVATQQPLQFRESMYRPLPAGTFPSLMHQNSAGYQQAPASQQQNSANFASFMTQSQPAIPLSDSINANVQRALDNMTHKDFNSFMEYYRELASRIHTSQSTQSPPITSPFFQQHPSQHVPQQSMAHQPVPQQHPVPTEHREAQHHHLAHQHAELQQHHASSQHREPQQHHLSHQPQMPHQPQLSQQHPVPRQPPLLQQASMPQLQSTPYHCTPQQQASLQSEAQQRIPGPVMLTPHTQQQTSQQRVPTQHVDPHARVNSSTHQVPSPQNAPAIQHTHQAQQRAAHYSQTYSSIPLPAPTPAPLQRIPNYNSAYQQMPGYSPVIQQQPRDYWPSSQPSGSTQAAFIPYIAPQSIQHQYRPNVSTPQRIDPPDETPPSQPKQ